MTSRPTSDQTFDLNAVSAYDYSLPSDLIAQVPVEPRDSSRLLVLNRSTGKITHSQFSRIGEFLAPHDVLVANQSRVLPARLHGVKEETGALIEVLLLAHRVEYGPTSWETLVKPARRLKIGQHIRFDQQFTAEVLETTVAGGRILRFWVNGQTDPALVEQSIQRCGEMPLPPYIHARLQDPERYQTVYSQIKGSAAAPTAGLHFTPHLIESLRQQGNDMAYVTLHVGLDTFRPVEEADLREHHMHSEYIEIDASTTERINQTRSAGKRIIAVGTTTVRVLESVAAQGIPLQPYFGQTSLFITPGYRYAVTDALITNFHLPKSTLLALVSAFAGHAALMSAYREAIEQQYRFYSFGDAMLII